MNTSNDVAVVTAIFGGFDRVHESIEQDTEADWFIFTDNPDLEAPEPWQVKVVKSNGHPAMAARRCKILPSVPHRKVIWIDANMCIVSPSFVREAWNYTNDGIAVFAHPWRDCVFEEAEAGLVGRHATGKYDDLPIRQQAAHYRSEYPEHGGLFASGTIAWDFDNPKARELGEAWMQECERWSFFCQLSLPVVCRRLNITPGLFPLCQIERSVFPCWGNRWILINDHA